MPSYKRPGVYAEEILLSPQQSLSGSGVTTSGAFVGANPRGPVAPTFISTWTEYVALFGSFVGTTQLPYALFQFFANGGRGVYVSRVAGPGNATASRTLTDRGGASAASTLQLSALNPGVWGNLIYIDVLDYGTSGGLRFQINVHYGDTTASSIVERWVDLSMNPADARYAPNVINAGNGNGSYYVVATDLFSANPLSTSLPIVQSGSPLAGGVDGTAPGLTEFTNAINLLDQNPNPMVLNLPGVTDTPTLTVAINYAANRGDIFVVCDTVVGLTSTSAISAVSGLPTNTYAAAYWPWIQVNDPSVATAGVTRLLPPGASVVGQYMLTDSTRGVFKAPAGLNNRIAGAVGIETKLTNNDLDALNTASPPVNAIRNITGLGPCIMGSRTLDPTTANVYVPVRRSMIHLKSQIKNLMQYAQFEPNDQVLWERLRSDVSAFLMDFWQDGGLRGGTPQSAFYVKCDGSINTFSVIQGGSVFVEVGVSLQTPAEFVVLRIGQQNASASSSTPNQ